MGLARGTWRLNRAEMGGDRYAFPVVSAFRARGMYSMDDGTVTVTNPPVVTVGSRVTIKDGEGEETYGIVPAEDSDPARRWINEASPLARALLGRHTGDVVQVEGPLRRKVTLLAVESTSEA
jgi:hypothetical protein